MIAAYGKRTYVEDVIEHTNELVDALHLGEHRHLTQLSHTEHPVGVIGVAAEIELGLLPLGQAWHADQRWKLVGPCGMCAVESNPRCRFCD